MKRNATRIIIKRNQGQRGIHGSGLGRREEKRVERHGEGSPGKAQSHPKISTYRVFKNMIGKYMQGSGYLPGQLILAKHLKPLIFDRCIRYRLVMFLDCSFCWGSKYPCIMGWIVDRCTLTYTPPKAQLRRQILSCLLSLRHISPFFGAILPQNTIIPQYIPPVASDM